jgi:hypothetical protein
MGCRDGSIEGQADQNCWKKDKQLEPHPEYGTAK